MIGKWTVKDGFHYTEIPICWLIQELKVSDLGIPLTKSVKIVYGDQ